jgi:hypothetical protein
MKFLHPILSWLIESALIFGDIVPSEAKEEGGTLVLLRM